MIFETDDKTLQRDLRAFLSLTADRQARFDAAPDAVPAVSGVNEQQKRLHPDLQTLRLRRTWRSANGLRFASLETEAGPAAVFRPGQQARLYVNGISHPVFFASAPADAAKGVYTVGASPETQPEVCGYLDLLSAGDPLVLRAPIGSFYYLGVRDRGPLAFVCDAHGLPAAAAFAAALPPEDRPDLAFYCVNCEPEPFFDRRFHIAASLPAPPRAARLFVCGSLSFCSEARALPAFARARFCTAEQPRRAQPRGGTFSCTLRTADGERTFPCSADLPLLAALEAAGVRVPANCSSGECGFCRLRLLSGSVTPFDPPSSDPRRRADAAHAVIHACRSFPDSDLTVSF